MTVDAYGKTVGGKLKLKGGLSLKCETPRMHFLFTCSSLPADGFAAVLSFCPHRPKKSQKKHKKKRDRESEGGAKDSSAAANFELVKAKGSGRILSSGTTLMGQVGTKFLLELSVGDAIIIQHPTSLIEETRIVRMVLSDISAAISSPFSSDLVSSTSFHYIKAPPEEDNAEQEEVQKLFSCSLTLCRERLVSFHANRCA